MIFIVSILILVLIWHGDGQQNCSADDCSKALGMEDNTIKNSQIIGGNAYNADYANFGPQNTRLHNSRGYRGDPGNGPSSSFIGINFGEEMVFTAIATQGFGGSGVDEWVTSFYVLYIDSKGEQKFVKGIDGQELAFLGNSDGNTVKRNSFPIPVLTSSVSILPLTVNKNVGLRLELYGCKGGHYFVVWLILKETLFTVAYTDPTNYEYKEAVETALIEIDSILGTTWGFLHAHIRDLSPQSSTSFATMVTAIVEIHCLRSSEQELLAKIKSAIKKPEGIFEPSYIKFQYPKRCGCAPPKVKVKLEKMMRNAEERRLSKFLRFPVQLEHSCPVTGAVFYSWMVSKIDTETGLFGPLVRWGRKEMFFLPLRRVGVRYAYIQCLVEVSGDAGSTAFDYGYIKVVRDPLVANITDITESSSAIMLSAKWSFDAGKSWYGTRGLHFTWFCRLENETFLHEMEQVVDKSFGRTKGNLGCLGFGSGRLTSRDEVLVLNMTDMVKSEKYIFKLVVKKDVRNEAAVYEFAVRPLVTIIIRCLSNCGNKVTPQDDLMLEAHCEGNWCSKVSNYSWTLIVIDQLDASVSEVHDIRIYPQMNSKRLSIDNIFKLKDDTHKHIVYVVKAKVQLADGTKFEGRFPFIVNSPPKKVAPTANCHVTPVEGEAISTDFLITCSGWNDTDQPLTYEFRYQDKNGMVLIQTGSLNKVTAKLPVGEVANDYSLALEVQVGDSFKDFTETRLLVKVRPPRQSDLSDEFVEKQLDDIRDSVRAGDADRATELAFMLMSTVKDIDDESFERKSSAILQDIKGVEVKSVVHVTKVAAVVAWATENKQSVPMSLQADALTLLTEATDFMASKFSTNSTHDAKLAQNVSSGLLNSIGGVLRISSRDAKVETKDNVIKENGKETTMKTLGLVKKVAAVLSSTSKRGQHKAVVKSNFVDIVIYRDKPDDLSGKNISEGGADVVMPDSKDIFPNSNESISLQMMTFKDNPYTWDKTASSFDSAVMDITLTSSTGKEVEVNNLSKPLALHIPSRDKSRDLEAKKRPPLLFLQPGVIRYHTLVIPSREHIVSLKVVTIEGRQLTVYLGKEFKPTVSNYTSVFNLPDLSSCHNNNTHRLSNCTEDIHAVQILDYEAGLYYVGIVLVPRVARLRRSCSGTGRRFKRSCVQVKNPPTTPPPTPRIINPQYDARTDVNYTLSVNMGTCLYWSEQEEKWSNKGCKVGSGSQPGRVHCLCNHLTSFGGDFFVAPNPIDFDKVWDAFGRLGETGNYAVLATVCSMLWLYLVGLLFARRVDKEDELKVVAEFQHSQNGQHTYSISIQTGAWRNCGTTANVGLILYGEDRVSNPIIFAHKHLETVFFARGSVNTFTMSLEKSLGSLYKAHVWHDNSGANPSWLLLEIVVEELSTKEKWHFIANRWLAVEKGLGEIELELRAASEKELRDFKNVLHSRAQKAVGDSHLWISLFTKPPQDQFTRCQRLSSCMSVIFCAMVTGAMFYRFGAKATDSFYLGPIKLSWTEIKIGVQSGLVAIPINFLVVTIFRNTKQSGDQQTSSGCLPHFFIYIGWVLCISAMLASAVFTVFYSLNWGTEISNQWLVSMTFSFFQDVLFIQPIKVLCLVCLLSMIIRKPLDHKEVYKSKNISELHSPRNEEGRQEARILRIEEIENARRQRNRETKAFRAILEIFFFAIFISLFVIVCYGNRDSVRYTLTKSIEDLFQDFTKVSDTSSLWNWTKKTFVPGLFYTRWYNDEPFHYAEGFIGNKDNFLVGMPRMRQVRILPEMHCDIRSHTAGLVFPRCLPFYNTHDEDTTPYNKPGWIPVNNISGLLVSADEIDSLCPKPWNYIHAYALGTVPIQGKMATYGGGGYVASLGYNSESALAVINSLEEHKWIDDKTVAVLLECTLFDPSTSLFGVAKYLYERYPTGGVISSGNIKAIAVYLPQGSDSYQTFYHVSQALLALVILGFAVTEIVKAFRGGRLYLKRFSSWVDVLLILGAAAGIGIMFHKETFVREYVKNVRANPFDNWSADHIVFWSEIEDYLISTVMFLVTIKSLRLIRFNRHIHQMRITIGVSLNPLCSFAAIFLLVVLAFASFGLLSFGSSVFNYSSLPQAVGSLLQILIGGKFSYYQLKFAADSFLGPLFLFLYLMTAMAILVNTFVAILNESYTFTRDKTTKDADEIDYVELARYTCSCLKSLIRFCCSFYEFLRESVVCRKRNTPQNHINGYHSVPTSKMNHRAPRLASMESLDEIQTPNTSYSLSLVDDLLSNVQSRLTRLSEETLKEIPYDRERVVQGKYSQSKLELESNCDSFLEGNLYHSSYSSSMDLSDTF